MKCSDPGAKGSSVKYFLDFETGKKNVAAVGTSRKKEILQQCTSFWFVRFWSVLSELQVGDRPVSR